MFAMLRCSGGGMQRIHMLSQCTDGPVVLTLQGTWTAKGSCSVSGVCMYRVDAREVDVSHAMQGCCLV